MIEINVTIIFKVLLVLLTNFIICFYLYRYLLYPKLRWWQKGNICHNERFEKCFVISILLSFIEIGIYTTSIKFIFTW